MTTAEFISAFRNGAIAPGTFHHEDHLRLAYSHLCVEPVAVAIESFKESLGSFLDRVGAYAKYHETVTVAYLLVINGRIDVLEPHHTWNDFKAQNMDLFDITRNVLLDYYEPETLGSETARRVFVPPDIRPIE